MRYFVKNPTWLQTFFPRRIWRKPTEERVVYLTFDDGPVPEVTPWVLDCLREFSAKGTFFCVGDNVRKHSQIYKKVLAEGHAIGNHTQHHLNGWQTPNDLYLNDVAECAEWVNSTLFRPPYGKLKPVQARQLEKEYQLIMWDVLSGDFDTSLSGNQCAENVIKHVRPGSIVVFHDSQKAKPRLEVALPLVLETMKQRGYAFGVL